MDVRNVQRCTGNVYSTVGKEKGSEFRKRYFAKVSDESARRMLLVRVESADSTEQLEKRLTRRYNHRDAVGYNARD